jgi:Flp pilus assembly protein TadB
VVADRPDVGWLRRWRAAWALLAGAAALSFFSGVTGEVLGVVAAVGTWVLASRAEPPGIRRRREQVAHGLPHVVLLLAAALRSGAAPGDAIALVCSALPGPATERLAPLPRRIAVGVEPGRVWGDLASDPELGALGRTLARAHETGAPVAGAVQRLAADLGREARACAEDRARAVGVRAALPLGLCLLPSFLLLGIVPLVAGLAADLQW